MSTYKPKPPLEDHCLVFEDDIVQNSYLKGLAMVAQFGGNLSPEQMTFLQQIIEGVDCDYTLEDYLRQGLSVTEESFQGLLEHLDSNEIKMYFYFDMLLLAHWGGQEPSTCAFVEDMATTLELEMAFIPHLTKLCRALLTRDVAWIQSSSHLGNILFWTYFDGEGLPRPSVPEEYL